jgi:hypothetical protein
MCNFSLSLWLIHRSRHQLFSDIAKTAQWQGALQPKNIPENFEHIVHKNANKPRAMAASFVTPTSGSVSSKIPSLVPSPLIVIGIMFTIPIIARTARMRPKLADMFKEMAST